MSVFVCFFMNKNVFFVLILCVLGAAGALLAENSQPFLTEKRWFPSFGTVNDLRLFYKKDIFSPSDKVDSEFLFSSKELAYFQNKPSRASIVSDDASSCVQQMAEYFSNKIATFKEVTDDHLSFFVRFQFVEKEEKTVVLFVLRKESQKITCDATITGTLEEAHPWTVHLVQALLCDDPFFKKHWGKALLSALVPVVLVTNRDSRARKEDSVKEKLFHEKFYAALDASFKGDFKKPELLAGGMYWTRGNKKEMSFLGCSDIALIFVEEEDTNANIQLSKDLLEKFKGIKRIFIVTESPCCKTSSIEAFVQALNTREISFPFVISTTLISSVREFEDAKKQSFPKSKEEFFEKIRRAFNEKKKVSGNNFLSGFNFTLKKSWKTYTGQGCFCPQHSIDIKFGENKLLSFSDTNSTIEICFSSPSSVVRDDKKTEKRDQDGHLYWLTTVKATFFVFKKEADACGFYLQSNHEVEHFGTIDELSDKLIEKIKTLAALVKDERIFSQEELKAKEDKKHYDELVRNRGDILSRFTSEPLTQTNFDRARLDELEAYARTWQEKYGTSECPLHIPQEALSTAEDVAYDFLGCQCADPICAFVRKLSEQQHINKPFIYFCSDIDTRLKNLNPNTFGYGAVLVMTMSQLQEHGELVAKHGKALSNGHVCLLLVQDINHPLQRSDIAKALNVHEDYLKEQQKVRRGGDTTCGEIDLHFCLQSEFPAASSCEKTTSRRYLSIIYTKQPVAHFPVPQGQLDDWISATGARAREYGYTEGPPEQRRQWLVASNKKRVEMSEDPSLIWRVVDEFVPKSTLAFRVYKKLAALIDECGFNRRIERCLSLPPAPEYFEFTRSEAALPYWHILATDSCPYAQFPNPKDRMIKPFVDRMPVADMFYHLRLLDGTHKSHEKACKIFIVNLSDFGSMSEFKSDYSRDDRDITFLSYLNAIWKEVQEKGELKEWIFGGYHCYVVDDSQEKPDRYDGVIAKLNEIFGSGRWKFIEGFDDYCARTIFDEWREQFSDAGAGK